MRFVVIRYLVLIDKYWILVHVSSNCNSPSICAVALTFGTESLAQNPLPAFYSLQFLLKLCILGELLSKIY